MSERDERRILLAARIAKALGPPAGSRSDGLERAKVLVDIAGSIIAAAFKADPSVVMSIGEHGLGSMLRRVAAITNGDDAKALAESFGLPEPNDIAGDLKASGYLGSVVVGITPAGQCEVAYTICAQVKESHLLAVAQVLNEVASEMRTKGVEFSRKN